MSRGSQTSAGAPGFDVQGALSEFADLNRRRLFGSPPLAVGELERWIELRSRLEAHFGRQGARTWSGIERRKFLRLTTHLQVELGSADRRRAATVRDVSQGGLFIATLQPLEKGTAVLLHVRPGTEEPPVELPGAVTWVRRTRSQEGPPGMGIAFDRLDAGQRAAVSRLVERAAREG